MKFLTKHDTPGEPLNRTWQDRLRFSIDDKGLNIEWGKWLTQFKGEPCDRWIGGWIFRISPFKWKLSQDHFWYDGGHCAWHFGPFTVFRDGSLNCDKCSGEK